MTETVNGKATSKIGKMEYHRPPSRCLPWPSPGRVTKQVAKEMFRADNDGWRNPRPVQPGLMPEEGTFLLPAGRSHSGEDEARKWQIASPQNPKRQSQSTNP